MTASARDLCRHTNISILVLVHSVEVEGFAIDQELIP